MSEQKTQAEIEQAAIDLVLSERPVDTIIEAIAETSILADALADFLKKPLMLDFVKLSAKYDESVAFDDFLREKGFSFPDLLIKAIRTYALEVAKHKGYI